MPQRRRDRSDHRDGATAEMERRSERVRERRSDRRAEGFLSKSLRRSTLRSLRLRVSLPFCLCASLSLCLFVHETAGQISSFEKRAISAAQGIAASELDAALPGVPFGDWFDRIIGPKAGVVWQLTECGEEAGAPAGAEGDLPACAEVAANLPNGRKVFVAINVGTFKKGMTGKPSFFRAALERNEQLYRVRRLSDLPEMLRPGADLSAIGAKERTAELPAIKTDLTQVIAPFRFTPPPSVFPTPAGGLSREEAAPAPPATAPSAPPATTPAARAAPAQAPERIPESESQSRAIVKVKPVYSPTARKMGATGTVEVEIVISEAGLVVEATAVSGHMALRSAAVEAARKWVFRPLTLNGEPVKVKSVLTFVFAPSAK